MMAMMTSCNAIDRSVGQMLGGGRGFRRGFCDRIPFWPFLPDVQPMRRAVADQESQQFHGIGVVWVVLSPIQLRGGDLPWNCWMRCPLASLEDGYVHLMLAPVVFGVTLIADCLQGFRPCLGVSVL